MPWTAAYVDTIGDPACDLRSNIAAEGAARIVYERLINVTDDAGMKEAPGFLMTREIAHQKSFEKALYAIPSNSSGEVCRTSSRGNKLSCMPCCDRENAPPDITTCEAIAVVSVARITIG